MISARRIASSLKRIYGPKYIFINVAALVIYYYVFNFLIGIQEHGAVIVVLPPYLIYLLLFTSSIAMTIGIYAVGNSINNEAKYSSTSVGTATAVLGTIIGGCNCTAPLLFGLTAIGINSIAITSLINFISAYEILIFEVMSAVNIVISVYYLDKLSNPGCMLKKKAVSRHSR